MDAIIARGLQKSFGENKVLEDVSFRIGTGDIFGFFGRNGSGKTTTLRLLLGLLKPDKGEALIFGKDFGVDPDTRRRVGVLLEENGMSDNRTAIQGMRYYAQLYGVPVRRASEVLGRVGLSGKEDTLVGKYSTGMKKKLGLARALLHEPELLMLDEPTSGLDPEAQLDFRELVQDLSRKHRMTVFLNTHNLDEAEKICTRIAILGDGKIKADGTLASIRKRFGMRSLEKIYLKVMGR